MDTSIPKTAPNCLACRWWQKHNSVAGSCRRMPPVRTEEGEGFPMTGRNDWCGEFCTGTSPRGANGREGGHDAALGAWLHQQRRIDALRAAVTALLKCPSGEYCNAYPAALKLAQDAMRYTA